MQTCTLRFEGMACGACENRVQAVARKVDGVSEVAASHTHGRQKSGLSYYDKGPRI